MHLIYPSNRGGGISSNNVQDAIEELNDRVSFKWIGDTSSTSHAEIDKIETSIKVTWLAPNYGIGISGFAIVFSAAFTTGWCAQFLVTCQDSYTQGIASRICDNNTWGTWRKSTFSQ